MAQQRPKQKIHSATHTTVLTRRKINSRRGPISRRRVFAISHNYPHSRVSVASSASPDSARAVLVPLQFNLRRRPSRTFSQSPPKEEMHNVVQVGSKRKRIGNANENGHIHTRSSRATGKFKRQRSLNDSSEEDVSSRHIMDVDDGDKNSQDWSSDLSDGEDGLLGDCKLRVLVASPSRLT